MDAQAEDEMGRVSRVSYGLAITQRAQEDANRVAVVCDDETLTRGELERRELPIRPIFGENVLRVLAAQSGT